MLIEFELGINDAEALMHHCADHQPDTGDFRENARLTEALQALASAINDAMKPERCCEESKTTIDPQLLGAALALFGDKAIAVQWLSKPVRALDNKRPIDIAIEDALTFIRQLEHGLGA